MEHIKLMQGPQDGRVLNLEGINIDPGTLIRVPRNVRSPIASDPLMRYVDTYRVVGVGKRGTGAAKYDSTEEA